MKIEITHVGREIARQKERERDRNKIERKRVIKYIERGGNAIYWIFLENMESKI